MTESLQKLKTITVPFIFTFICLSALYAQHEQWQNWRPILRELPLWLLPISALIAIQFNRSRIAYLALLFALFFAVDRSLIFDNQLLVHHKLIIFTAISINIAFFSLSKDRGIVSIFTIINIGIVALLCALAYLWHYYQNISILFLRHHLPIMANQPLLELFPWMLSALIVLISTFRAATLTSVAVAISFCIWSLNYFKGYMFPSSILLTVLAIFYLISILFDSYKLAYRDELTLLPSRRALYNLVVSLSPKYTVAMADIDHFKNFNDTYGHDVGDQVLKLVASKLAKVTGGGKVFRYGGEEFTIIFPRKKAEDTFNHLENVRLAIENYQIALRSDDRKKSTKKSRTATKKSNAKVSVTISIGVAEHAKGEDFDKTLKQADLALYDAKKKGRNQVCVR